MAGRPGVPVPLLLLAAGALLGWCVHALTTPAADGAQADGDEGAAPQIAPEEMAVAVTTAAATRGDLPLVIVAAGEVRAAPGAEHVLTSRAGGRVLECFAASGQHLRAGDPLLRFDPAPLQAALSQAHAALAEAESAVAEFEQSGRDRTQIELNATAQRATSQLALAEAEALRRQTLHADGLASDRALAEARQAATQARVDEQLAKRAADAFRVTSAELQHTTLLAARVAAQAALRDVEIRLGDAELVAPCDGQLVEFFARPGESFDPGAVLGELLAPGGRVIVFGVAASAADELQPGAPAWWDDAAGVRRSGTLSRVGGEVDPASGLLPVFVVPDEGAGSPVAAPDRPASGNDSPGGAAFRGAASDDAARRAATPATLPLLPPGLAVRGELQLDVVRDAVLVPERAVLRAADRRVVVLADGDRARVVPVTLAGRHAGLAAVEGDVHAGDRVIVDGGYNLPDGAHLSAVDGTVEGVGASADGKVPTESPGHP